MVKNAKRVAGGMFSLLLLTAPASAQWGISALGVAEYDTNETLLLLAGLSASPGGRGLAPLIGVQTYYLTYEAGTASRNIWSVRPYAGVKNGFGSGSVYGTVGYAFRSNDDDPVVSLVQDTEDGVTVSGGLDYWGTGGPLGAQVLASYNFGGESLWTRGRLTTRLSERSGGGQIRVGGEVAYMTSDTFDALQPGGVLEWHNGRGLILGFGAGVKLIDGSDDDPVYFRGEIVFPVR